MRDCETLHVGMLTSTRTTSRRSSGEESTSGPVERPRPPPEAVADASAAGDPNGAVCAGHCYIRRLRLCKAQVLPNQTFTTGCIAEFTDAATWNSLCAGPKNRWATQWFGLSCAATIDHPRTPKRLGAHDCDPKYAVTLRVPVGLTTVMWFWTRALAANCGHETGDTPVIPTMSLVRVSPILGPSGGHWFSGPPPDYFLGPSNDV